MTTTLLPILTSTVTDDPSSSRRDSAAFSMDFFWRPGTSFGGSLQLMESLALPISPLQDTSTSAGANSTAAHILICLS